MEIVELKLNEVTIKNISLETELNTVEITCNNMFEGKTSEDIVDNNEFKTFLKDYLESRLNSYFYKVKEVKICYTNRSNFVVSVIAEVPIYDYYFYGKGILKEIFKIKLRLEDFLLRKVDNIGRDFNIEVPKKYVMKDLK